MMSGRILNAAEDACESLVTSVMFYVTRFVTKVTLFFTWYGFRNGFWNGFRNGFSVVFRIRLWDALNDSSDDQTLCIDGFRFGKLLVDVYMTMNGTSKCKAM
jgi:hypothetical protein